MRIVTTLGSVEHGARVKVVQGQKNLDQLIRSFFVSANPRPSFDGLEFYALDVVTKPGSAIPTRAPTGSRFLFRGDSKWRIFLLFLAQDSILVELVD